MEIEGRQKSLPPTERKVRTPSKKVPIVLPDGFTVSLDPNRYAARYLGALLNHPDIPEDELLALHNRDIFFAKKDVIGACRIIIKRLNILLASGNWGVIVDQKTDEKPKQYVHLRPRITSSPAQGSPEDLGRF